MTVKALMPVRRNLDIGAMFGVDSDRAHSLGTGIGVLKHPRREPQPCGFFMPGSLYGGPGGEPQGSPVPLRGCPVRQPVWAAAPIGVVTAVDATAPTEPSMNSTGIAEEWRPIPEFPRYEVSDLGRVRWRHRVRKPFPSGDGYPMLSFWKDGKSVHRSVHVLVASAFLGPKPPGFVVRHRNGVKTDCQAANLIYGTASENEADKVAHGTIVNGEKHPASKLTADQVREIRRRYIPRDPVNNLYALGREFGVGAKTVHSIVRGEKWKHIL